MIDLSIYDWNKIKEIDKIFMFDAQKMNQMEWDNTQPLWRRLLFLEKEMPNKYKLLKESKE